MEESRDLSMEFLSTKTAWMNLKVYQPYTIYNIDNFQHKGDLVQQKNPTCWVETYQGGLSCCHHGNLPLDKDQTPPEELLSYQMKFR